MILYPKWLPFADGITLLPNLVLIRENYRNNIALHNHEFKHVEQMQKIGVFKFWFLYLFSSKFRLDMEVEAYKVSIKCGVPSNVCAEYLVNRYRLDITFIEAMRLLNAK